MSAAEEPTPFQQAVDGLELDPSNSSCIFNTEGGGSQMGGIGDSVDINNIVILIVLFHGVINLTEEQIRQQLLHPTINTDSLTTIDNLAYLSFAPTGMVNIGLIQELDIIKKIVDPIVNKLPTTINPTDITNSSIEITNQVGGAINNALKPSIKTTDNISLYILIGTALLGMYFFLPNKKKVNNKI